MPTIALRANAATIFDHRPALDIRIVVGWAVLAPRQPPAWMSTWEFRVIGTRP